MVRLFNQLHGAVYGIVQNIFFRIPEGKTIDQKQGRKDDWKEADQHAGADAFKLKTEPHLSPLFLCIFCRRLPGCLFKGKAEIMGICEPGLLGDLISF